MMPGAVAAPPMSCSLQPLSSFHQFPRRGFHARRKRLDPGVAGVLHEPFEPLHLQLGEIWRHVLHLGGTD